MPTMPVPTTTIFRLFTIIWNPFLSHLVSVRSLDSVGILLLRYPHGFKSFDPTAIVPSLFPERKQDFYKINNSSYFTQISAYFLVFFSESSQAKKCFSQGLVPPPQTDRTFVGIVL